MLYVLIVGIVLMVAGATVLWNWRRIRRAISGRPLEAPGDGLMAVIRFAGLTALLFGIGSTVGAIAALS